MPPRSSNDNSKLVTLVAVVVVVVVLYAAQTVLLPLALAILLTFLLAPLVVGLQHLGFGRVFSVLIVTGMSFLVMGLLAWIVAGQIIELASQLPQYKDNITAKIQSLQIPAGGWLGKATESIKEISEEVAGSATQADGGAATQATQAMAGSVRTPPERPVPVEVVEKSPNPFKSIAAALPPLFGPLASAGIVIVFVFFMLIQREDLRDRVIGLIGQGQLTMTTKAIDDAVRRVSRYLTALLAINATYGLAVGIGLYFFIGLPNAVLWAVLAAMLRFIPYVGPWIGAALPVALSLAVSKGWSQPLMTVGLFVVIELVSNNLMEPLLYGSRTGLTPVAVLLSAVFWAWLWGPVGLVLATPLTVCLVVIGRYVPQLGFLSVLLGDQPSLPPEARVYQRLLAMDQDEVYQLAEENLKDKSLLEFYDQVLIPALNMAERDRHHGDLEQGREQFIYTSVRDLIENLGERHKQALQAGADAQAKDQSGQPPGVPKTVEFENRRRILCLPARDDADEIVAIMLAQVLQMENIDAHVLSVQALAGEALEMVEQHQPEMICISAMPPLAVMHSRYLCKRLADRFPDLKIMVGLWHVSDLNRAKERIRTCGTERVVSTLSQAIEQLRV